MKIADRKTIASIVATMVLTSFIASGLAQELSIPDSGLDASVRQALQKPRGPLSAQDLLSLTNPDASQRNISQLTTLVVRQ